MYLLIVKLTQGKATWYSSLWLIISTNRLFFGYIVTILNGLISQFLQLRNNLETVGNV